MDIDRHEIVHNNKKNKIHLILSYGIIWFFMFLTLGL